jgi:hypothetical protein
VRRGLGSGVGRVGCGKEELRDIRGCSGVEQNVSVLQVLCFRAVLKVLLQTAAPLIAANRRDGGSVDGVSVFRSHVGLVVS